MENIENTPKEPLNLLGLTMLGLGGAIGSGIFVAIGIAINQAGPAIILAFVIAAIISSLIMRMLAEMSVHETSCGSFSVFAQEYLGPAVGFISGWMYWLTGILTLATEMIAAALILRFWLPSWPVWLISLFIEAVIIGISLLDVKAFARLEETLSFIKVGILIVIIVIGVMLFTGTWSGLKSPGLTNFLGDGGFFPHGWKGVFSSLLLVLYTFAGEQVIGLAVGETQKPEITVPKAVTITNITLIVLYLGAITTLVGIIPWQQIPQNASGFVPLFQRLNMTAMTGIMNAIILSAILSAMNSNMYGVPRMLKSLAERHDAPAFLKKVDRNGIPRGAIFLSSIFLLIVVGISYVLPQTIFVYIASASGVTLLINWIIIALTHLRFRKWLKQSTEDPQLRYRRFPYSTLITLLLLLVALSTSALNKNQMVGLALGITLLLLLTIVYFILIKCRTLRQFNQ